MLSRRGCLIGAGAGLLGGCGQLIPAHHQSQEPAALRPGRYRLDPAHAAVGFKVDHLGFSRFAGRFNRFDASLDFDAATPEAARLEVLLDIASLDVNAPVFADTLRGPGWFDAARFPQARFVSQRVTPLGPNTGKVAGDLTLHGVTAPFILNVTFNGGAANALSGRYTLGFSANGRLRRSAFGIDALVPAVGDAVELDIEAEFQQVG